MTSAVAVVAVERRVANCGTATLSYKLISIVIRGTSSIAAGMLRERILVVRNIPRVSP